MRNTMVGTGVHVAFDFEEALARTDNDRELLCDLLGIFKEDFPKHRESLSEAIKSKEAASITAAAHTLKGMLLNLSANPAAEAAARVEHMARQGVMSGMEEAFETFEHEIAALLPQIDAFMAEALK